MPINWNLMNPADVGNGILRSFEQGRAIAREAAQAEDRRELRGALADLTIDPENQNALAVVMKNNPEAGMRFLEYGERQAFRRDMGEWLGPQNALGGPPVANPPQGALVGAGTNAMAPNALMPAPANASFDEAFAPLQNGAPPAAPQTEPTAQPQEQQPDLSFLGEPQNNRDQAFMRMLRRDPERALKIQSQMRDSFVDRLKVEREFYGIAVEELSRVGDEAGWQQALRRIAPYAQQMGADLSQIPTSYPGPDRVREMLEQSLPTKERLDYLLREENQEADNARADRNTDSLIGTREDRLDEYRRANRAREGNTRRGQEINDARGRRGQDIASGDRQRGQDISSRDRQRGQGARVVDVKSPEDVKKLPKGTFYRTPDNQIFEVE